MGYYNNNARKKNNDPRTKVFGSWSPMRTVSLLAATLLCVALVVLVNIPVGVVAVVWIATASIIWKDINDDSDVIRGNATPGTIPYKIASFFSIMKGDNRSHIFSPVVAFGFGPPENDIHKGMETSMFSPPTRLSAWMSLAISICVSFVEYGVQYIRYPLWGTPIPSVVTQIISIVGFFAFFQIIFTVRRYQLALMMAGVQYVPAVMLHGIASDNTLRESAKKSGLIAAVTLVVLSAAVAIIMTAVNFSLIPTIIVVISASLATGSFSLFRMMTQKYREEFNFQVERREFWSEVWAFLNTKAPFFEMQVPVPSLPGKPGNEERPQDDEDVHVWAATFSTSTNGDFATDYANQATKISPSIPDGEMVIIAPIPRKDKSGQVIPGSISDIGFRVMWTDEHYSLAQILSPDTVLPAAQKEIAVRYNVIEPIARIKQIGRCSIHSHMMMTSEESPIQIIKVSVIPREGITASDFMKRSEELQRALSAEWVRAKGNTDALGQSIIDIFIGNGRPNDPNIVFPRMAASKYRKILLGVDWEYAFYVNKVASAAGSPSMILSRPITEVSNEIIFDLPPGVGFDVIQKNADNLKSSSGNQYIEIHPDIPSKKQLSSREKRELKKYMDVNHSVSQFTAVAASTHPLNRKFLFSDYQSQLVTGREPGVAKVRWSPGPKSNGDLVWHDFSSDMAHLLVAGSSGSGKSVLLYNMLCQLMANNSPNDVQIQIVDPKIGFQNFQYCDNVTRYVDQWTPDENFYSNVRDMLRDLNEEMVRRNRIFRFAPSEDPIDKLAVARSVALKQGPNPDGSPNELMQPFIIAIIDEVAMLFAGAPDPETKALQDEILFYTSKLARESRSAGIHMVLATQYPTNASLPSLIRQQCGRIGLQTQDAVASKVIIDTTGLEDLWIKGSGKIQQGKNFYDFRGLLLEDDETDTHSMKDILASVPSRKQDRYGDNSLSPYGGELIPPAPNRELWEDYEKRSGAALDTLIRSGHADAVPKLPEFALMRKLENMDDSEFLSLSKDDFVEMLSEERQRQSRR